MLFQFVADGLITGMLYLRFVIRLALNYNTTKK